MASRDERIPIGVRELGTVVFADIVSYSKRPTVLQQEVVALFTEFVKAQLFAGRTYPVSHVFAVPTGDGVAICFREPSEGYPPELLFLEGLARRVKAHNDSQADPDFEVRRWSAYSNAFTLRVGVARGELLLFSDVNDQQNFSGRAANDAARLMTLADPDQALFSLAYRQMLSDFHPHLVSRFRELPDVTVKGQRYQACQLCHPPFDLNVPELFARGGIDSSVETVGFPVPWMKFDHSDPHVRRLAVSGDAYEAVRNICVVAFGSTCGGVRHVEATERGTASLNYCVTTDKGTEILIKRHRRMSDPDRIASLYEIQERIAKAGIFGDLGPSLVPIRTDAGASYYRAGSELVSAFPFVGGVSYFGGESVDSLEEVGSAYGKVNRVLANYRPSNDRWPLPRPLEANEKLFEEVIQACAIQRGKDRVDETCYILEKEEALIRHSILEARTTLPASDGAALVELHPHNVFFRNTKCVLVFDYEWVTDEWPEIAACSYALHRFCREYLRTRERNVRTKRVAIDRFIRGYESGRGSSVDRVRDELPFWIRRTNVPKLIRTLGYLAGVEPDGSNRTRATLLHEATKFLACLREADSFAGG